MQVNGKELELDIFELDTAERFETAMKTVHDKMQELNGQEPGLADGIRLQCEAIADCFDAIFGKGTAANIFDGRVNLKLALQSFAELVEGANAQKADIGDMSRAISEKYSSGDTQVQGK